MLLMPFRLAECWARDTRSYVMAVHMARRSYHPGRGKRWSSYDDFLRSFSWPGKRPRQGRHKDKDDGGVPVEPNKPNTLSGGAAAELEFDD